MSWKRQSNALLCQWPLPSLGVAAPGRYSVTHVKQQGTEKNKRRM